MSLPNHSALELSVYQMVLNRLPFMDNTVANTELCAAFTLEVMEELEPCFMVNEGLTIPPDVSLIGDENEYSTPQRVVVADLVAYYILFRFAVVNTAGDASAGSTPLTSFLKSAKAGSVSVEFEQIDASSSVQASSVVGLMKMLKDSAIRKAATLGCIIDLLDGSLSVLSCLYDHRPASFKVTPWCDGTNDTGVTEQG